MLLWWWSPTFGGSKKTTMEISYHYDDRGEKKDEGKSTVDTLATRLEPTQVNYINNQFDEKISFSKDLFLRSYYEGAREYVSIYANLIVIKEGIFIFLSLLPWFNEDWNNERVSVLTKNRKINFIFTLKFTKRNFIFD